MIFQSFSNIERRFSVFLLKLFWRGCENCTSLVHKNTLMNSKWIFFWKKWRIFLNFFRPLAKIFWPSVLNFPAGCQTWILRVQNEHFEEEKFFWKNIGFLTFLNFEQNTFYAFCQKKIVGVVKLEFTYPWNSFEGPKNSKNVFLPFSDIDQEISGLLSKLF